VAAYHEAHLANLLEHVREGFSAYDAGEIGAFELDDIIHRYKRAAQKLWGFCMGTGGAIESAARVLEWSKADGNERDWWDEAAIAGRS
jgi:hypothetical protein